MEEVKLKARIIRQEGMFVWEVWGDELKNKEIQHTINYEFKPGWNKVTQKCITEWGCKIELRRWKQAHIIKELEI